MVLGETIALGLPICASEMIVEIAGQVEEFLLVQIVIQGLSTFQEIQ
jgi:hypothetical protein